MLTPSIIQAGHAQSIGEPKQDALPTTLLTHNDLQII
jgi:hypothetical protein